MLGPFEVLLDGQPLELTAQKPRALLAALVLRANQVVSTDRLIDELWGDEPPATAPHVLQVYLSQLRKLLAPEGRPLVETRAPGYVLRVGRDDVDLNRFETQLEAGSRALGEGDPRRAAAELTAALALWRGTPLADLADEPFAHAAILRLEELRLLALEERLEADLALGRHDRVVPELRGLTHEQPHRERLWAQLMTALYRSGRQGEALETYRAGRQALLDELGIEPTPALQGLHAAILRQDAELAGPTPFAPPAASARSRTILAISLDGVRLPALAAAANAIARGRPAADVVLAHAIELTPDAPHQVDLPAATRRVEDACGTLATAGVAARSACFRSYHRAADVSRLAMTVDADLLLLDAPANLAGDVRLEDALVAAMGEVACDAAVAVAWPDEPVGAVDVLVPFGGNAHDWAALELAGRLVGEGCMLRLVGISEPREGVDASFLLATASLAMQRVAGVAAESLLVPRDPDAVVAAAADTGLVVVGLSSRGLGASMGSWRLALIRSGVAPVLLVRRGVRPGLAAPREAATRFTWSTSHDI